MEQPETKSTAPLGDAESQYVYDTDGKASTSFAAERKSCAISNDGQFVPGEGAPAKDSPSGAEDVAENPVSREIIVKHTSCVDKLKSKLRKMTKKQIVGGVLFAVMWTAIIICTLMGYVKQGVGVVSSMGVWAHVIIFVYFTFVSTPIGYGYTIGLVAFGYALGFAAVPTAYAGYCFGTFLTYVITRYVAHKSIKERIEGVLRENNFSLDEVVSMANGHRFKKYLGFLAIRHISFFTLGWINSLLCIVMLQLNNTMMHYMIFSFLTELPFLCAWVGIGDSVAQFEKIEQEARDGKTESTTASNLRIVILVFQVCCTILILVGGCWLSMRGYKIVRKRAQIINAGQNNGVEKDSSERAAETV